MKYPNIIFLRYDKYKYIDEFIEKNREKFDCTVNITNNFDDIKKLFDTNHHILITFGTPDYSEYTFRILNVIKGRLQSRWIHKSYIHDIDEFNNNVNYCYIDYIISSKEEHRTPFSIFTTCYLSYEKIYRAYNSIAAQTLKDWEWVIIDDSPDDKHFEYLKELAKKDPRIRLYNRDRNSGNIGNVKNEAVSLCRGKYVLELDHDDQILPDVLSDAYDVFEKDQKVGFIYMDFINIYENGENFKYNDFICKGYGGYYSQKYKNRWVYVYATPNINNITLSALVCCPNHPRIWRRRTLFECGNYSEYLPICDDYELLLHTALKTKIVKISKLGYVQYMNDGHNNFSLIRNGEINRIGPHHIYPMFFRRHKVHENMKKLGGYEDEKYVQYHEKLWERKEPYRHFYSNDRINNDYDKQICIIGFHSLNDPRIRELYKDERNDFLLLDNKYSNEFLQNNLDKEKFTRMKCYALHNTSEYELVKYFKHFYLSVDEYLIIANQLSSRHEIINIMNEKYLKNRVYLEIGVEHGNTFKFIDSIDKIGVDPAPEYKNSLIIEKTSDEFFKTNTKKYDSIFIDGMHQSAYVIRDVINSLKYISNNGIIFMDDILPITQREQYQIPIKHHYDKNILKYGESWTGDVWKVMYYLIIHFQDNFKFTLFQHPNYRGVGCLRIIEKFTLPDTCHEEIKSYDYNTDFEIYKQLVEALSKNNREWLKRDVPARTPTINFGGSIIPVKNLNIKK